MAYALALYDNSWCFNSPIEFEEEASQYRSAGIFFGQKCIKLVCIECIVYPILEKYSNHVTAQPGRNNG